MKSKSVGKNAVLNLIKTFCSIAFPLITFPYVTRVLQADNLGKVNYANSIVQYFVLIAVFGTATYATRECSAVRDNKTDLQKTADEIFGLNIITFVISLVALAVMMGVADFSANRILILIYSTELLFKAFSFEWINSAFEDYAYITVRTIVIQTASLVLTFILVKGPNDYYKYAIIQVAATGIICISNIFYTRKYLKVRPRFRFPATFVHLKSSLFFFANSLAITIYCNSDITMLGIYHGDAMVGLYSVSAKIYTILKNLIAAILVVCIPRLSNYFNQEKRNEAQELIDNTTQTLLLLTIPLACGMGALSSEIVRIVAGAEYIPGAGALSILSVSLVFAILGGIVNNCVLIPIKQEKISLISTISAAVSNFGLNFIMIPRFGVSGAAITTVIAEAVALLVSCLLSAEARRIFRLKSYSKTILHACIGGISVLIIVQVIKKFCSTSYIVVCISVFLTVCIYLLELVLLKDKTLKIVSERYLPGKLAGKMRTRNNG